MSGKARKTNPGIVATPVIRTPVQAGSLGLCIELRELATLARSQSSVSDSTKTEKRAIGSESANTPERAV